VTTDPHVHEHVHEGALPHVHPHAHEPSGAAAPPADGEPARGTVDLAHVHFRYPDGFEALRGVDLRIDSGEKVALVGPNGAGKSTLMLQLNGTLRPEHGSVRVAGLAVGKDTIRRVRAEVGLVFQDPDDQLFSPTVFDDVAFGPLHMGLAADEVHRRVERALAAVGMAAFAHRVPHRMSLGQRKRVALATVLSMDPSILVFDEPSAGLDPRGRRELIRLLRTLDQTMLVSTHDMRLVAEVFPRTVVMDDGLVVADGPTGAPRGARARGPVGRPVDRPSVTAGRAG
jgi:cobalt/nickel transport system ATP-binding protein